MLLLDHVITAVTTCRAEGGEEIVHGAGYIFATTGVAKGVQHDVHVTNSIQPCTAHVTWMLLCHSPYRIRKSRNHRGIIPCFIQ